MTQLKDATKNFIKAGKTLLKSVLSTGEDALQTTVKNVKNDLHQMEVKQTIKKNKVVDIKQDKSKRKYHRGG